MNAKVWCIGLLVVVPFGVAFGQSGNCTQRDGSTRPDCPQAIAFFRRLHAALMKGDRQSVASLIDYPLRTSVGHKRVRVRNQAQFLAHYDEIFDKGVRCEVLNASEKDVWGNWQGFTVGDGAIWFDAIIPAGAHPDLTAPDYWTKYPFKVETVNNDSSYPCAGS